MNNWKKYALGAVLVTAAGFAYVNNSHRNIPTDLRDAVIDGAALDSRFAATEKGSGTVPVPKAPVPAGTGAVDKGYAESNRLSAGVSFQPVQWVTIPGGKFMMGTDGGEQGFKDTSPRHEVDIRTFDMSKTLVTVEQYADCVAKGRCTKLGIYDPNYCNWGMPGRELHPINCVSWRQANQYAEFIAEHPGFEGARLSSESEWEYAAKSGGRDQKYPWGDEAPTCDKAVMYGNGGYGCSKSYTMPVCSKPAGNTAQGLCDMAGNIGQWVQDKFRSYKHTPVDGRAYESVFGSFRVLRGGCSRSNDNPGNMRVDYRQLGEFPDKNFSSYGFRLARSSR